MQAVLLMSVFEQRLSFQTFYFITSDPRIIVNAGGDLEVVQVQQSVHGGALVGTQGVKVLKNYTFLHLEGK